MKTLEFVRFPAFCLPALLHPNMEHKAIVDHLLAENWEAAARSMEQHLDIAYQQAVRKIL